MANASAGGARAPAEVIRQAAATVKAGGIAQVRVTGHTDTLGVAGYNQALSGRRAAAVARALVADGVAPEAIATLGVGKSGLLVATADGVRGPQNRRAAIALNETTPRA